MSKDTHNSISNIRIIFFGTPSFVVPILEALEENFEVVGVVTNPDQKVGRKQVLTPSAIASHARRHLAQAQVLTPEKLNDETVRNLKDLHPELFVVAAYGIIIPQSILEIPKYGTLNIHYSLLPKYRGASPIQTAILNGDKTSGTSIIKMDKKMDHGPVLITKEIILSGQDTFESLNTIMTQDTIPLLIDIIPDFITGKAELKPQNEEDATYTKIIHKEDGYFDINNPPATEKLDRMIRAYSPWPGVWTKFQPQRGTLASLKLRRSGSDEAKIVKFYPGNMVQMEGKKPTKLEDFLRGYPDFPLKEI